MASIASHARGAVFSPEMVVLLTAIYLFVDDPDIVSRSASIVAAGPEAIKFVALVPAAVLVWCISEAKSILLPEEDIKAILIQWPRYSELKSRVVSGLFFQLLFAIGSFLAWAYSPTFSSSRGFSVMCMSVMGSFVGASTFFLAAVTLRGIMKRASI